MRDVFLFRFVLLSVSPDLAELAARIWRTVSADSPMHRQLIDVRVQELGQEDDFQGDVSGSRRSIT